VSEESEEEKKDELKDGGGREGGKEWGPNETWVRNQKRKRKMN